MPEKATQIIHFKRITLFHLFLFRKSVEIRLETGEVIQFEDWVDDSGEATWEKLRRHQFNQKPVFRQRLQVKNGENQEMTFENMGFQAPLKEGQIVTAAFVGKTKFCVALYLQEKNGVYLASPENFEIAVFGIRGIIVHYATLGALVLIVLSFFAFLFFDFGVQFTPLNFFILAGFLLGSSSFLWDWWTQRNFKFFLDHLKQSLQAETTSSLFVGQFFQK